MAVVAKTYRGNTEDLFHHGRIAVTDANGNLLYSYGDVQRLTYARSGAKPMQAIAVCESGAPERYGLTQKELAVICASHNGESFHIEAVKSILTKAGIAPSCLLCGNEYPIAEYAKLAMLKAGEPADALHCDCSGKHAGMLITAKAYGESLEDYNQLQSRTQQRILRILSEVCDCPVEKMELAIDGCGVPVHAMPFYKLAQGFAKMSQPALFGKERAAAVQKITDAMTAYPEMVAGTDRFCTELMTAFGDRLFGKSGAASFYGIGIKNKGIGIAVKIEDGCSEFVAPVVAKVLVEIGVIRPEETTKLTHDLDLNLYSHSGVVVGRKEICFKLIKHSHETER